MIYFQRQEPKPTCAGHDTEPIYVRKDIEGIPTLVPIGTRHIQEEIDSNMPPKLSDLFARATRGDTSGLLERFGQEQYGDVSDINDLGAIFNASREFDKLKNIESYAINSRADKNISEVTNNAENT